jgi:1-acyl-sn-glycerol-3-phosphate acyltransferase
MLSGLPAPLLGVLAHTLLGVLAFSLLLANTLLWVPILLVFAAVKLVLPFKPVRLALDPVLVWIAEAWIACNSAWMALTQRTQWDVQGVEGLDPQDWYLVNSNHQCAADIFVLQHLLNRRIPLLKFFIKQQLIWMPVIGLAWWALDFPFMRRHSEAYLKKRPEMRAKDQEATRKACAKFALIPTSVTNFMEGTRFTPTKHARQQSPYRFLLKPKAGGVALALSVMGDKFQSLLDVTIVYPDGIPGFWAFLCGRMRRVIVRVRRLPIPRELLQGDYGNDPVFRQAFSAWVQQVWWDKDAQIAALLDTVSAPHKV